MKFKESETVELKKSTLELKEAVVSMVAMLNKHGRGTLYFGIKNDGAVLGQSVSENTVREISKAVSDHVEPKIYPKIKEVELEGKKCVLVEFSGNDKPYFAYGRAYIRVGDENKQLSAKELEHLFYKKNIAKWDSDKSDEGIESIDEETLKEFIQRANESKRISFKYTSKKKVLEKLGLLKDSKITNAARLLFSKNEPVEVQAAVFAGTDKTTFLDIKQFKGNIFQLLTVSEGYIKEHINWKAELVERTRKEIPEIPLRAITEALVNSFCHRDYLAPESNKIAIYKNKIDFWNPGEFPEGYCPQDFIKQDLPSILRNPQIAKIMYLSEDIEKFGSGLKRIYTECCANKIKVSFELMKYGFSVRFIRPKISSLNVPINVPANVPKERIIRLFKMIEQNNKITALNLAKTFGVTDKTIKRDLQKLKKQKRIKRVGSAKTGYWKVIKKQTIHPDKGGY